MGGKGSGRKKKGTTKKTGPKNKSKKNWPDAVAAKPTEPPKPRQTATSIIATGGGARSDNAPRKNVAAPLSNGPDPVNKRGNKVRLANQNNAQNNNAERFNNDDDDDDEDDGFIPRENPFENNRPAPAAQVHRQPTLEENRDLARQYNNNNFENEFPLFSETQFDFSDAAANEAEAYFNIHADAKSNFSAWMITVNTNKSGEEAEANTFGEDVINTLKDYLKDNVFGQIEDAVENQTLTLGKITDSHFTYGIKGVGEIGPRLHRVHGHFTLIIKHKNIIQLNYKDLITFIKDSLSVPYVNIKFFPTGGIAAILYAMKAQGDFEERFGF